MPYEVRYSEEAVAQLRRLRAFDRAAVLGRIEKVLTVDPTSPSKVGIKLLRQPAPTQYRLRVSDFRVFYDVEGLVVLVVQILSKDESIPYLGGTP